MAETAEKWRPWHTIALLIIVIVIGLIGWLAPTGTPRQITLVWLGNMLFLMLFSIVAGDGITGLWRGVLIDERNKMSLSRLQLLLWTILILSSFLTATLINIHRGQPEPLSIALPGDLWLLMGISTTSLIGSPLIRNSKKAEPTNDEAKNKTLSLLESEGVDSSKVKAQGQIIVNQNLEDASWSDLFKGEEVGNAAHLDLGKVQMFYFTLIILTVYAIALGAMFQASIQANAEKIASFPDLGTGMVALLGISHAGYLASKAVPHTPPEQPA
jgi:hypothetical protein